MRVYIIARDIQRQDAVGNFCRQIQSFLQAQGYDVHLAAENCHPEDRTSVADVSRIIPRIAPDDLTIFHFSTEDPAFAAIAARNNPKVLYFHNITPENFFRGIDPRTARLVRAGLDQRPLAAKFDVLMANSRTTAQVLCEGMDPADRAGINDDEVIECPPLIDIDRWNLVNEEATDELADRRTILYVGRLAPHKGVRQLIEGFALLAARDSEVRLLCVGDSPDRARLVLSGTIEAMETSIRKRIRFAHGVSEGALKWIYRNAGVCASMSMHEGFGVPLVDAMVFDKPLVLNREAGMMDTAGSAAIPVDASVPAEIAKGLEIALNDEAERTRLASARAERLRVLRRAADGHLILEAIERARASHRARIV